MKGRAQRLRRSGRGGLDALTCVLMALLFVAAATVVNAAPKQHAATGPAPPLRGLSLGDALRLLQGRGWPIVFSDRLVRGAMRVEVEPVGSTHREMLAALLAPHGLGVREGARGHLVVVVVAPRPPTGDPGLAARGTSMPTKPSRLSIPVLDESPAASVAEEILVTPDRDLDRGSSFVLSDLDPDDPTSAPRLGVDPLAAVANLPGASTSEGSAQISVRGGDGDDVLVRLDGFELVRPYHLFDFDGPVSFVAPGAVDRAEVFTGGYPAQYGDRMSGVVDLTSRTPMTRRHVSLGASVLDAEGAVSGLLGDRARWLLTARSGSYQWPLEASGSDQHPRYGDVFGKIELDLGARQTLFADGLIARDRFELSNEHGPADTSYESSWDSSYAWMRHTAVLGRHLYVESMMGAGDLDQRRSGGSTASEGGFGASDRRALGSSTLRQDWHWEAAHFGATEWGFDLERSQTRLDSSWSNRGSAVTFPSLPGVTASEPGHLEERLDTTNTGTYVSTELLPAPRLSLEVGLRNDTQTLSGESDLSPRLSVAWELSSKTVLRGSWGWFYQSQRPYELQLDVRSAEGLARIASERAEHQDLSFEHRLTRGMTIAVVAYRRRFDAPRVRFENLFDPVLVFPELGFDRVRIAPDGGSATGVELTVRQSRRGRFGWWATFTESSIVDEIDGQSVPRSTDQPESFRAGLSVRAGRGFDVNLLWQYHTGWPTTAIEARGVERDDGSIDWAPVLGPRNGERLPDYHRLDLRIARSWSLGLGRLEAHLDLLDLYDRDNLRGFENLRLAPDGSGGVTVERDPVTWTGFVPSVGVRWSF